MSALHVFGDSFASNWGYDFQWMQQLSDRLGCTQFHATAQPGSANEWFLMMMADVYSKGLITRGDYVVITLSAAGRQWLIERVPQVGNWANMRNVDTGYFGLTELETQAIDQYYHHLYNPAIDNFRWDAYAAWCTVMSNQLLKDGIRLITLEGFGHSTAIRPQSCVPVTGSLYEISEKEFVSKSAMDAWYDRNVPDQRLNHLLRDNHEILAEKLYQSFAHNEPLNLVTGFKTKRITGANDAHIKDQLSPVEML